MQQILYIGKFFPKSLLKTIKEDSGGKIGFSNHNFEMSMIHGLCAYEDLEVRFISIPRVYSFPYNNKKIWTNSEAYIDSNHSFCSVGFCNIIVISQIWKLLSSMKCLITEFKKFSGPKINVIVNTPTIETLLPLYLMRKLTKKDITITLVVPDIPSFVSSMDKTNSLKKAIIGLRDRFSMKLASKCENLVLLTEQMMDFFPSTTRHIVMEGVVDVDRMKGKLCFNHKKKKSILYTGTLRRIFGVMDLVDAFELAGLYDTELWICGSGDSADEIMERAQKNTRIKFLGLVDSDEALQLQRDASVLVNPRTSEGEFTKYSFPSKTMEYLLSGNPVIAHALPGIPREYFDYVKAPENESVESLAQAIKEIMIMTDHERALLGNLGRDFVINQKNSKVQMGRILDLLKSN